MTTRSSLTELLDLYRVLEDLEGLRPCSKANTRSVLDQSKNMVDLLTMTSNVDS